jgi:hypothetical protein
MAGVVPLTADNVLLTADGTVKTADMTRELQSVALPTPSTSNTPRPRGLLTQWVRLGIRRSNQ